MVTFTATVPSGATGTIQFRDSAANLGGPVTIAGGVAAFAISTLSAGTHLDHGRLQWRYESHGCDLGRVDSTGHPGDPDGDGQQQHAHLQSTQCNAWIHDHRIRRQRHAGELGHRHAHSVDRGDAGLTGRQLSDCGRAGFAGRIELHLRVREWCADRDQSDARNRRDYGLSPWPLRSTPLPGARV